MFSYIFLPMKITSDKISEYRAGKLLATNTVVLKFSVAAGGYLMQMA